MNECDEIAANLPLPPYTLGFNEMMEWVTVWMPIGEGPQVICDTAWAMWKRQAPAKHDPRPEAKVETRPANWGIF